MAVPPRTRSALVDVLDRLLDRGAVLQADVVISVAGVPMLGLSLRAALGSVDALVAYGIFAENDPIVQPRRLADDPGADVGRLSARWGAKPPPPL